MTSVDFYVKNQSYWQKIIFYFKHKINPDWHEAGHFYPSCNFGIGFCQLNLYKKFPNFFGGENWHQLGQFDCLPSLLTLTKLAPRWRYRWPFLFISELMPIRVTETTFINNNLLGTSHTVILECFNIKEKALYNFALQSFYSMFTRKTWCFELLLGHQKCTFKS